MRSSSSYESEIAEGMEWALQEARKAYDEGEVPVGAVLVRGRQCVARARNSMFHTQNPLEHAEIKILASWFSQYPSKDSTKDLAMYVTLEPCPMCAHAIRLCRIPRLYFGAYACGFSSLSCQDGDRHIDSISDTAIPSIYGGIQARASENLLKRFFHAQRSIKNV